MNPTLTFHFDFILILWNKALTGADCGDGTRYIRHVHLLMSIIQLEDNNVRQIPTTCPIKRVSQNFSFSSQICSHETSETPEPAFPFDLVRCSVLCSLLLFGFEFDVLCSACRA
jgi:hypothetical protein